MSDETVFARYEEHSTSHYYGDVVRGLFITGAVLCFLTQFFGTRLPFSPGALMLIIIVLVIAAGITNPVQHWIHWVNVVIASLGLLLFGGLALARLHSAADVFSQNGIVAVIAVVFLAALYYGTSTVRGILVPHVDPNETPRPYIADPE